VLPFSFGAYLVLLVLAKAMFAPCQRRGSRLALALLVTNVFADNHDATVATDDLALVANLLDAWVYLHVSNFCSGLLLTVENLYL
jgi:hypothetical protein